jgi:hypothetical protein
MSQEYLKSCTLSQIGPPEALLGQNKGAESNSVSLLQALLVNAVRFSNVGRGEMYAENVQEGCK